MEQTFRRVMSGQQTGIGASLLRFAARVLEPLYAAIVSSRNSSYSRGVMLVRHAARPVISVGNITTGGTGKTPVVRWLAEQLRASGKTVGILMRGYKAGGGRPSDEHELLNQLLNPPGSSASPIIVHANPNRAAAAEQLIKACPDIDVFLMDDGFQHRRLHREFDLVLIDATNPFGYDHVLPRGLLREPLEGLSRASAVLLTRVDQALPDELAEIERSVRRHAAVCPVYRCEHAQSAVVTDRAGAESHAMSFLRGRRIAYFCGIGNPESFERQLRSERADVVAHHHFGDHHDYRAHDLDDLQALAQASGAEALVTTEKDWIKVARVERAADPIPIWRVRLDIRFPGDDGKRLLAQVLAATGLG